MDERGLFYLAHLVQVKNNLNRERRRFAEIINPSRRCYLNGKRVPTFEMWRNNAVCVRAIHKGFSKRAAQRGYKNAQKEMKAMTAHMREVRTELGARFMWGWSSNIQAIILENKRYNAKDIARLADWYLADSILLG